MAEQTDKEVCSICLNDFQEPVITDCQHSFCFTCLDDYVKKTSTNDQFICPLCRCLIQPPSGGLTELRPKPNIEDHSTISILQCDVCTEETTQYFCRQCDQYLCKSCKTMHDKMKICKDHVIFRCNENQIGKQSRSNEPMTEWTPVTSAINHKDFCAHHKRKKNTMYCKRCSLAMCRKCFVTNHNGHNYLDLQDDEAIEDIRDVLRSLNYFLDKQITNFQKQYDTLNSKLTEVKNFTKTECDKVDAQVDKICSEVRKIGENIKKEMQKTSKQEESKFGKLMEDIYRLIEDLKASVKYSVNILEDSSIIPVLQRLPKVQQENLESDRREFPIPDVRYSKFQAEVIDKTLLLKQLGKIVSFHQTVFEEILYVDEMVFDNFYFTQPRVVSGFKWYITASVFSSSLFIGLNMAGVEDDSIASCKADVTFKVINKTDDRQSVVKQCVDTVKIGICSGWLGMGDGIDWSYFENPVSGFIVNDTNLTIQVTINDITDIERRSDGSDYYKNYD